MKNYSFASGFLLLELSIACFIIVMITYITSMHSFFSYSLLNDELYLIEQTCLELQLYALQTQSEQKLLFNCHTNSYSYLDEHGKMTSIYLKEGVRFGLHKPVYGPPSKPHTLIQTPATFIHNEDGIYTIIFPPTMSLSSGTIYLCDEKHDQIGALTIAVDAVATIRTYSYSNALKKWNRSFWSRS